MQSRSHQLTQTVRHGHWIPIDERCSPTPGWGVMSLLARLACRCCSRKRTAAAFWLKGGRPDAAAAAAALTLPHSRLLPSSASCTNKIADQGRRGQHSGEAAMFSAICASNKSKAMVYQWTQVMCLAGHNRSGGGAGAAD